MEEEAGGGQGASSVNAARSANPEDLDLFHEILEKTVDFVDQIAQTQNIVFLLICYLFGRGSKEIFKTPQAREYIGGAFDRASDDERLNPKRTNEIAWQLRIVGVMIPLYGLAAAVVVGSVYYAPIHPSDKLVNVVLCLILSGFIFLDPLRKLMSTLRKAYDDSVRPFTNNDQGSPIFEKITKMRRRIRFMLRSAIGLFLFLVTVQSVSYYLDDPASASEGRESGGDGLISFETLECAAIRIPVFVLFLGALAYIGVTNRRSSDYFRIFGGFGYLFLFGSCVWSAIFLANYYLDGENLGEGGQYIKALIAFIVIALIAIKWFKWEKRDFARRVEFDPRPAAAKRPKAAAPPTGHDAQAASASGHGVPPARQAMCEWLDLRKQEIDATIARGEDYPIFVASAQGGGMYAAWYTAMTLGALQDRYHDFGKRLFAISAVSGGGVGAQLFSDVMRCAEKDPRFLADVPEEAQRRHDDGPHVLKMQEFFKVDYQSPLIGMLLFGDVLRIALPRWLNAANRASALEWAFDYGWNETFGPCLGETSKRLFFSEPREKDSRAPYTVINTTLTNNGSPILLSPFYLSRFDQTVETISKDAAAPAVFRYGHFKDLLPDADLPITTAVLLGARFPYVTPGGRLPETTDGARTGREFVLADGGYYDNTGAASALAIIDSLKRCIADQFGEAADRVPVKLIRMLGPDISAKDSILAGPDELSLPLRTLYRTRFFRRDFFAGILGRAGIECYDLQFNAEEFKAPLSWQLSRATRRKIYYGIKKNMASGTGGFARMRAVLEQMQAA